jgi:hypothetical protein
MHQAFSSAAASPRLWVRRSVVALATTLSLAVSIFATPALAKDDPPPAPVLHQAPQTLDNSRHYINKDGQAIHSPTKTSDGKAPNGASAHCRDGSYSFSAHRRGTCSHHGGVGSWL